MVDLNELIDTFVDMATVMFVEDNSINADGADEPLVGVRRIA